MKGVTIKKKVKFSHSKWTKLRPGLHWRIALSFSFVLILAAFAFGLYLFIGEKKAIDSLSIDKNKELVESINRNRLQGVLDVFKEREEKSNTILNSPPGFSDPSI